MVCGLQEKVWETLDWRILRTRKIDFKEKLFVGNFAKLINPLEGPKLRDADELAAYCCGAGLR